MLWPKRKEIFVIRIEQQKKEKERSIYHKFHAVEFTVCEYIHNEMKLFISRWSNVDGFEYAFNEYT